MANPRKNVADVLTTMVSSGTNLTDKMMGVPLSVARMTREELFRVAYAGVEWMEGINQSCFKVVNGAVNWMEGMNQSSFKVVRELLQRIDKLSQEAVEGLEAVTDAFSDIIKGSGEAARDMVLRIVEAVSEIVSRTATSLTGTRERSPTVPHAASA